VIDNPHCDLPRLYLLLCQMPWSSVLLTEVSPGALSEWTASYRRWAHLTSVQ
jgi:hypothetical protein